MSNKKIRVLHISAGELYNAGIEAFIMNVYRNIDRENVQFDFVSTTGKDGFHDDEFKKLGGEIISLELPSNPNSVMYKIKYFFGIYKIIKAHGPYKSIHYHQQSWVDVFMLIAFFTKVPVRISHSHNTYLNTKYSFIKKNRLLLRKLILNVFSTHRIGCSVEACESLFGKISLYRKNTKKINNGIDLSNFQKSSFNKNEVMKELSIPNKVNFIHVGRFSKMKNHEFLVNTFYELTKLRNDIHLTIVGWGELEDEIKERVRNFGIQDKVSFLPSGSNIPKVLSAMDFFIFPSTAGEGLGIVLIEAQAMGIPVFASTEIPKEADLGLCTFISLEKGEVFWAKYINDCIKNQKYPLSNEQSKVEKYDIKKISSQMKDIYTNK